MKNAAILALTLLLGFGVAVLVAPNAFPAAPTIVAQPMWAHHFETVTGLVAGADVVAIAEPVTQAPGRQVGGVPFTNHGFIVERWSEDRTVAAS